MPDSSTRELPLRDIFLTVGSYLRNGLRWWWLLLLAGLVFAGYKGYTARQQQALFSAPLTFVLNEDSGGPAVGGLLGQLGIGGGGGAGTTPDKISALAKSQKIVHGLLLDTIVIEDRSDRLINHLIETCGLVEEWELPEGKQAIINDSLGGMTEQEKSLLKNVHYFLFNEEPVMIQLEADENTGIISLNVRSRSQGLSLALSYGMYERLSAFYTEESTGNSRATVARLQVKSDSIAKVLSAAEYRLARLMDTRLGTAQQRDLVQQAQLTRQVQLLNLTYAEVLRNLETASFALSTQTPFFQTVDVPFSPLIGLRPNWKKVALTWFFTGAFLGFLLASTIKFYHDVMRANSQGGNEKLN